MYDLVSKIPDGLNELKRLLETYIYNQGMEAIEKCCEAAINVRQNFFYLISFRLLSANLNRLKVTLCSEDFIAEVSN